MKIAFAIASFVAAGLAAAQTPALKIVVLEGEDAVNVIQQKTAVRALVEVRDRNNLPVPGAVVTFTMGGGQHAAFAGGLQTLTVTTNAAGQAAAAGISPITSGAFQIQVQAAFQGQVATAAISQTNFATAAAAAQAGAGAGNATGAGAGNASGASGGAAGGGGGLSATTIGIIGAAVGGGALAATKVVGAKNDDGITYSGSISGQLVFTNVGNNPQNPTPSSCVSTRSLTGTLKITLKDANANGTASLDTTHTELSVAGASCIPSSQGVQVSANADVSGGPGAITFTATSQGPGLTTKVGFNGSLAGDAISGTLTMEINSQSTNTINGITSTFSGSGSTSVQVALQKQP